MQMGRMMVNSSQERLVKVHRDKAIREVQACFLKAARLAVRGRGSEYLTRGLVYLFASIAMALDGKKGKRWDMIWDWI